MGTRGPLGRLRRAWCEMWAPRVPEPWPAGAWHCPTCGRSLVGQGRPGRTLIAWEVMSRSERVQECLVHGCPLPADQRVELDEAEILRRVTRLADGLADAGWRRWAHRLADGLVADDWLFHTGHHLTALRRSPCVAVDDDEVDRLRYAVGVRLPAPGPRPPGPPLVNWPGPPP